MRTTICYGLSRLVGFVGSLAAASATVWVASLILHFDLRLSGASFQELWSSHSTVVVIAILAGFVGGGLGQLAGAGVDIESDEMSAYIDALWHVSAYGVLVWLGMSAILAVGAEDRVHYIFAFAVAIGLCLSFGYIVVEFIGEHYSLPFAQHLAVPHPFATCITGGIVQCVVLHVPVAVGVLFGVIAPVIIMPTARRALKKDAYRRRFGS